MRMIQSRIQSRERSNSKEKRVAKKSQNQLLALVERIKIMNQNSLLSKNGMMRQLELTIKLSKV